MGPIEYWPEPLLYALDLIDLSAQPMVIAWGPQRLMFHNEAFTSILSGKTEVEGLPLHEVFAESWDAIGGLFARAEAGESIFVENWEAPVTRNGRTESGWWSTSYSPLPTRPGEVGGVLCIVQEMTRMHLAEEGLRAAQAELTLVTDAVPGLLWRADRLGRTVWRNARLRALYSSSDAVGGNEWADLVHPEDLDGATAGLREAKLGRAPFSRSLRLRMPSGDYRRHLARLEPIFGEEGSLSGWCGVATDIQELAEALEALDRRTALLGQFAANTDSLIWILDLDDLTIERLTPNFNRIWPDLAPDATWRWDQFLATVHDADRPAIKDSLARASAGRAIRGKFRVVMPGGGLRLMDCTLFPIPGPSGRISCLGGALRDLTRDEARVARLVDPDPASRNRLSHGLRKLGFDVTVFESIDALADVAAGMAAGPLLYHHQGDMEALARLAGLMKTRLSRDPWMVLQAPDRPVQEAVAIMKLGACDLLAVDAPVADVVTALNAVAVMIRPEVGVGPTPPMPRYRLTRREYQIAQGLVAGGTNKTIGQTLGISPRTVESHRGRLMERLGVETLAQLVALVTAPGFDVDIRS